jgi:hypothetical protein
MSALVRELREVRWVQPCRNLTKPELCEVRRVEPCPNRTELAAAPADRPDTNSTTTDPRPYTG